MNVVDHELKRHETLAEDLEGKKKDGESATQVAMSPSTMYFFTTLQSGLKRCLNKSMRNQRRSSRIYWKNKNHF